MGEQQQHQHQQRLLVLYEDVDERAELESTFEDASSLLGPEPNAYYVPSPPPGEAVRFSDIVRHFPLSKYDETCHFIFRVQNLRNVFTDLTNPSQIVPRLGPNGAVVLKVFRSPTALKAASPDAISASLLEPVPASYFLYLKTMDPVVGVPVPKKHPHMVGGLSQETLDEALMTAKAAGAAASRAAAAAFEATGLDEEAVAKAKEEAIKKAKLLISGVKGLWKKTFQE